MIMEEQNRLNELVVSLKDGNTLFYDHIYFFNPFREDPAGFQGITDMIPDYVYIQNAGFDASVVPDQFQKGRKWGRTTWKMIGRSLTYPGNEMLQFCINRAERVGGINVIAYAGIEDSERIYFEETGQDLQSNMNLIRVTFTVSSMMSWCKKSIDLCSNGNC